MTFRGTRFLVLALTVAVGTAAAVPARAAGDVPRSAVPTQQGVVALNGMHTDSTNGLLDCDMAIYVTDGSNYTSLAAEGHYKLNRTPASFGTFMDNLGGGQVFQISANHVSPTTLNGNYVVNTANGRFTFHIGSSFVSTVPAKYGPGAKIGTILYGTHAYTIRSPLSVTLGSFTIGGFQRPAMGTLTLTTDAIGYIVPFNQQRAVNSSFSYTLNGALHQYPISSYGRYYPPDGAGDGSLTTVLSVGAYVFHIINAKEDTSGQKIISGDALAGVGTNTIQASFSAH